MLTAKLLVLVEIELTGEAKYLKVVAVAVVVVAVKGSYYSAMHDGWASDVVDWCGDA